MKDILDSLAQMVEEFGTAPTFEEMPRRTLQDKGIGGPTAAHVIEEVHVPLNLAYLSFTTGSSAFQNIVGVTHPEMEAREKATRLVFEQAKVQSGSNILFTYPPLVNVFTKKALDACGMNCSFLRRSSRDAFLAALYNNRPDVVVGESSFLRSALEDAKSMGMATFLPKEVIILAAGTPLDLELPAVAERILNGLVHDLYGCQEFGWITINGIPVRDDITLVKSPLSGNSMYEVVVGGLPMGDSFPVADSGHICNSAGKIITYRRERTFPEYEVIVRATTLSSDVTIGRVARTILRIKGRIVKVDPGVKTMASQTMLELCSGGDASAEPIIITGPQGTGLFDELVKAQLEYQQMSKSDPVWVKKR
ncbi:hypothetical protein [Pelosinus fermentans]|uniref:Uncharacterized protein n=1 Tax=Pelosinus fermentans JBW45 TaxID=1192197 RepID=I8TUH8_9FIRM|nr:hypothetical protein [Pelosinus fermentans]AJQ26746.1 hypothetical protein JBW_01394 [Pelosinus fermentans JBW45]